MNRSDRQANGGWIAHVNACKAAALAERNGTLRGIQAGKRKQSGQPQGYPSCQTLIKSDAGLPETGRTA